MINQWWSALATTDQLFWGIAIISTAFFCFQTLAMLMGFGDADGMDADAPTDAVTDGSDGPMDLFTLRNMVNFFLGFGWAGVSLRSLISSTPLLVVVSLAVGVCFVALFIVIFKQMMKLEKHGNVDFRDAIGTIQQVYLRIPAAMSGSGKVQVSINGAIYEVDAVTEGNAIPSGAKVRIIRMQGDSVYIVEQA